MIRRVLFFVLISVSTYAQDTLAVIEPKYAAKDFDSFSWGDSVFIRIGLVSMRPGVFTSIGGWYYHGEKIADVNLDLNDDKLLGFHHYRDTAYYYGYDQKGQKSVIKIFRAIGIGEPSLVSEQVIEGKPMGAVEREGAPAFVTFNRREKTFRVFEMHKANVKALGELTVPWKIENVENQVIGLVTPTPNSSGNLTFQLLKVFFDGNTLGVVFDDHERDTQNPNSYRKTVVIRKDLVTGQQKSTGIRVNQLGGFRSYLDGNMLYRLMWGEENWKIVIHNLDSNKIVQEFEFPRDSFSAPKTDLVVYDFGLAIDSYDKQKVITLGVVQRDPTRNTVFVPIPIPGVALVTIRSIPTMIACKYYAGSPQTGFATMSAQSNYGKILAAYYELTHQQVPFDYTEYSMDKRSLVAAYSVRKSLRYTFLKFPMQP